MERLLADAEQLTGIKYDISNFGDVTAAIHAIQGELGITGVAAAEASTTFTGSFAAMQASAQNLMADLALGNSEAILTDLTSLSESISAFLTNNLLPMIGNILSGLPAIIQGVFTIILPQLAQSGMDMISNLSSGVLGNIPTLIDSANQSLEGFLSEITAKLPNVLSKGVEIITNVANGILTNMPAIITSAGNMINTFVNFILQNLPTILEKGVQIIQNVANGIIQNRAAIVTSIQNCLTQLLATIASNLPAILQKGIELIGKLAAGIIQSIPTVLSATAQIISNIISKFTSTNWGQIGHDIIAGIKKGLMNAASSLYNAIKDVCKSAFNAAKDFFGIGSPSRLFASGIGKWLPAGIAVGVEDNLQPLTDAMDTIGDITGVYAAGATARQSAYSYGASLASGNGGMNQVVGLLEKYLPNIGSDIYMDGAKVGKVVNKQLGLAL